MLAAIMMGLVVVFAVADRGAGAVTGGVVGISFLRGDEVEIADRLFARKTPKLCH